MSNVTNKTTTYTQTKDKTRQLFCFVCLFDHACLKTTIQFFTYYTGYSTAQGPTVKQA
jgi:hypothetical protein